MAKKKYIGQFELPEEPGSGIFWLIAGCIMLPSVILAIPCFYLFIHKQRKHRLFNRFKEYCSVIGARDTIPLQDFKKLSDRDMEDIRRDVQKMVAEGYFGEGAYVDVNADCLVVNNSVRYHAENANWKDTVVELLGNLWQDLDGAMNDAEDAVFTKQESFQPRYAGGYQKTVRRQTDASSVKTNKPAEQKQTAETPKQAAPAEPKPEPKKDRRKDYMDELERILNELYDLNEKIEDEAVSARIDRIGELTAGIFRAVIDNPSREGDVRKFMNYYLPTTLKLLKSYDMLEDQRYQGENIVASRKKIENVLDMLIEAFERQLDRLFKNDALDIATDIDVLETMMAGDGLSSKGQMRMH